MKEAELISYRVTESSFHNRLQPGMKVQFENGYSYHAQYTKEQLCHGEMKISVRDKEDEKRFSLTVTIVGVFRFQTTLEKETIHAVTFKQLFPYAKSYISMITAAAGMAPIMIPQVDIDDKTVYRFDIHPEGR